MLYKWTLILVKLVLSVTFLLHFDIIFITDALMLQFNKIFTDIWRIIRKRVMRIIKSPIVVSCNCLISLWTMFGGTNEFFNQFFSYAFEVFHTLKVHFHLIFHNIIEAIFFHFFLSLALQREWKPLMKIFSDADFNFQIYTISSQNFNSPSYR